MASFSGQLGSMAETANATSHVMTLSAGASIGSLVVVGVLSGSSGTALSISDSKSNSWTSGTAINTPSAQGRTQTFWSVLTVALVAADTITVSTGATSTRVAGLAGAFAGSSGTSATVGDVQVQAGSSTATTTPSVGTTAATAGDSIVVGNLGFATVAGTVVAGSGYTLFPSDHVNTNNGFEISMEYKFTTGSSTESAGWTLPLAAAYHGDVQTFKVAAAGGAVQQTFGLMGVGA